MDAPRAPGQGRDGSHQVTITPRELGLAVLGGIAIAVGAYLIVAALFAMVPR